MSVPTTSKAQQIVANLVVGIRNLFGYSAERVYAASRSNYVEGMPFEVIQICPEGINQDGEGDGGQHGAGYVQKRFAIRISMWNRVAVDQHERSDSLIQNVSWSILERMQTIQNALLLSNVGTDSSGNSFFVEPIEFINEDVLSMENESEMVFRRDMVINGVYVDPISTTYVMTDFTGQGSTTAGISRERQIVQNMVSGLRNSLGLTSEQCYPATSARYVEGEAYNVIQVIFERINADGKAKGGQVGGGYLKKRFNFRLAVFLRQAIDEHQREDSVVADPVWSILATTAQLQNVTLLSNLGTDSFGANYLVEPLLFQGESATKVVDETQMIYRRDYVVSGSFVERLPTSGWISDFTQYQPVIPVSPV